MQCTDENHSGQKWRILQRTTRITGNLFPRFALIYNILIKKNNMRAHQIMWIPVLFWPRQFECMAPFWYYLPTVRCFSRHTTVNDWKNYYSTLTESTVPTVLAEKPTHIPWFVYDTRKSSTSGMRPHYLWLLLALHVKIIKICQNCCVVIPQIPDENTRIVTKMYNILIVNR